ncbi:MAG: hypothetical protein IT369_08450 [Candidatus Latescibacteria bacterium]|nr:hypothetical protein [Candidatus Latescibacterota bacterium]
MNERERFIRTLTCSGPDRPSYGDYFAYDSTRQRWEREGLPKGLDHGGLFDYFGMDHIEIWGRDRLPLHAGIMPSFEEALIEETDEYLVRRLASGDLTRVRKDTPPPAMPQYLAHPVTDRASWAEYRRRLDPEAPGRLPADLAQVAAASPTRDTPLGVWFGGTFGYLRSWMGLENACYAFHDDPAWVEEMIEHLTLLYASLARRVFAAGVQLDWVMFWEDMAYNHGSLLSPALYRRYCLPFYHTLMEIVHQHGVPVVMLDSDGDIGELAPIWLDLGIAVMHPMEAAAGTDVREYRRRYGRGMGFLGGIDKRALAAGRGAIDREVIPKVQEMLESGGGLVAEVDHGIPPDISLDNYRYFRDLLRRLCEQ